MGELEPWATTLGVVLAAALASLGTIIGSRWSHRNERARLRNELVTILGQDRNALAEQVEKARGRANEVDEELEKVRDERRLMADELAATKIAHREAIADMNASHRAALDERDSQRRQVEVSLSDVRRQLMEAERALTRCQDEIGRREQMIQAQGNVIAEMRSRMPGGGGLGGIG